MKLRLDRRRIINVLFVLSLVAAVVICWEAFTGSPAWQW